MSQVSPILLQAQIDILPGGELGLADTTRLENPFQGPMWLDEIRFTMVASSADGGDQSHRGIGWSSLFVRLSLGNIPLTNGRVPISLLGKALNDSNHNGLGERAAFYPYHFTWRLPKPLFIPARELLRPTIYYESYTGAPSVKTVTIQYACRPVAKNTPTPRKLNIPWVSYFRPAITGQVDSTDQSTPANIFNPWDQELHVQRFIGRLMPVGLNSNSDPLSGEDDQWMSLASATLNTTTGLLTTGTLVSAQDSFNNILIRDPTPFAHVFNFVDRSWTVNCVLPPKGFYLFTVDRYWANYAYANAFKGTVGISMVGWREVDYAQRG